VNLKKNTNSVHFQVEKYIKIKEGIVRFERERVNIGRAMNLKEGIFTAPVAGLYHFQFVGLKDNSKTSVYVYIMVNGNGYGVCYADTLADYPPLILSTSLPLKSGDRVWLQTYGSGNLHEDGHRNVFTGWLVEELPQTFP